MRKILLVILMTSLSLVVSAKADLSKQALKYIPDGKVEIVEKNEVRVKTPQETFVEIEFNRDGTLEEASGDMAQKDTFNPGEGLMSLKDAVASMKKDGKNVDGEWSLDKDFLRDWEYEFEGVDQGKKFEYVMNAKTGKLLESKPD